MGVGVAHNQEVDVGAAGDQHAGGVDQHIGALVGGQEADVGDDAAAGGDAELGPQLIALGGPCGRVVVGAEALGVDAVGHGMQALGGDRAVAAQQGGRVMGRGQHRVGAPVDEALQAGEGHIEGAGLADEAVVEHLAGHAALIVEDERGIEQLLEGQADRRGLVGVGVNDIGAQLEGDAQGAPAEADVQVELVARRAHHGAFDPGDIPRAADVEPGHLVAIMVGDEDEPMAAALHGPRLFPDPHVVAVVREEARRGEHEHSVGHASEG